MKNVTVIPLLGGAQGWVKHSDKRVTYNTK